MVSPSYVSAPNHCLSHFGWSKGLMNLIYFTRNIVTSFGVVVRRCSGHRVGRFRRRLSLMKGHLSAPFASTTLASGRHSCVTSLYPYFATFLESISEGKSHRLFIWSSPASCSMRFVCCCSRESHSAAESSKSAHVLR